MSFLELDIELWKDEPSFKYSSIVIDRLVFTNDSAECGVKLTSDFIDTAKIEDNLQNFYKQLKIKDLKILILERLIVLRNIFLLQFQK